MSYITQYIALPRLHVYQRFYSEIKKNAFNVLRSGDVLSSPAYFKMLDIEVVYVFQDDSCEAHGPRHLDKLTSRL